MKENKKVLINVVHPKLGSESRVNRALIDTVKSEANVTINNLYEKYPDFRIDVEKEQKLLLENDIVIFQFPMYWLSSPSLLKEWFDVVLSYNFAFGEEYKLENKIFAVATTAGSGLKQYNQNGSNKFTVEEFLNTHEAIANYVKMDYRKPFIVYETFIITDEQLQNSVKEYKTYIEELSK
ncbi:NAD(P)H-dependent oxidoreductase [Arcobacter porcinus]|uniref:General stress protein 14 n=1 Tax=Arcobacter porcinus TaxID=1935204 RepID=A0ABX2YDL3_9BACT|nr:NAD(P)H-dependent oxidoreductase [Arcobacter porcinus]OCL82870.1 General stress protein 14 [Arcobacter porcinus]OCL85025.1 General stress protein 14 [Arcobacter porcinus]OCL86575.1 General stress protein 14 [Arcobacter porcinus]OCL93089.1 General stress protein 14 [Arcobacter porcinus]